MIFHRRYDDNVVSRSHDSQLFRLLTVSVQSSSGVVLSK
jgi:hypothetical protein